MSDRRVRRNEARKTYLVSPLARRRAGACYLNLSSVKPANGVRILAHDVTRFAAQREIAATGEAERLSRRWRINLAEARPTGFRGTVVTAADVALARQRVVMAKNQ